MQRLTRQSQSQSRPARKASRFIRNTALVTKLTGSGMLPIRHDSLPTPFVSFEVETSAGKRYLVQARGRQTLALKSLQVGQEVSYEGKMIFPRVVGDSLRGGYFLASSVEVTNTEISPYITGLINAQTEQSEQQS